MANVMLKSVRFTRILNGRLSFSSVKHFHEQHALRSYTNTRQNRYATAAYKIAPSEDLPVNNYNTRSNAIVKDLDSIDSALSKLDSGIRRSGRTQLKFINNILSSISSKECTSSTHGLYLLRSCKYCYGEPSSKRIELVNQIWNRYQELGVEFDVRHFNALLDVHVANGLDFNPADILTSMDHANIEPNKATYLLIMKRYCQDGNISGASEILEYMKEKKISADEKVFNYLIEGHIKNNDIEGAREMLDVMRSSNLEPTAETHAVLACGYAAMGNKDEMMNYLRHCNGLDTAQNHLKVIEVLATSGNHQYIDEVLSLIQNKERYQQEFIIAAVELIHKNLSEVAYSVVKETFIFEYVEGINIFVKQLVKVGKPLSEVMQFCDRIMNDGYNINIYVVASKTAAEMGQLDNAVSLFKKMQEIGQFVRPRNFSPLFEYVKQEKSPEGPWLILQKMCELGIPCDFRTYIEDVFPVLGMPHPDDVIRQLKSTGHSLETARDALFVYYCDFDEIDHAEDLCQKYPVTISNRLDLTKLVNLYTNMGNEQVPKYLKLLKFIFEEKNTFIEQHDDVQGRLLAQLIMRRPRLLETLLSRFMGIKFNEQALNICEQQLKEINPSRLMYVKRLKLLSTDRESLSQLENMSVEEEDKYIDNLQDQHISIRPFLTRRIQYHIREKNIGRVNELMTRFHELQLDFPPLVVSNLIGLWTVAGELEKATAALQKLTTEFPTFTLDLARFLNYVNLMLKYEKFDESYEALKKFLSGPLIYNKKESVHAALKRINLTLSATQNVEFAKKMQSVMMPLSKELGSKKSLLDSVISLHLQSNKLPIAYEEFRNAVINHHVAPCLNKFLSRCIQSGENNILQKIVDLTTQYFGKSFALIELAVAFLEANSVQRALKVIESLGAAIDPKALDVVCEKLHHTNKLYELEQLIFITKSLNLANREKMYCYAFKTCALRNDFQRALKLYEELKEDVVHPSSDTTKFLEDLFKKHNQTLPESFTSKSEPEISTLAVEATKDFYGYLEAGNVEAALNEVNSLKKGYVRTLSFKSLTDLVELCLQQNRVHDLSLSVYVMSYIIDNAKDVLNPILEKYAEAGDVEKFALIARFMPDFSLMSIGFNTYFCKAYISSGQYDNLLAELEARLEKKNKLFCISGFENLLKLPELEDKLFNLAAKYFESNFKIPMSVVWAHYFSKENYEKANEISKNFALSFDKVDNIIVRNIKQSENIDIARHYIKHLNSLNVRPRLKERAYGTALDLLVFKGLYDEAVALILEAENQKFELHKYYLSTFITLKNILEKDNKAVPFKVPLDVSSGSSSDSE